MNNYHNNDNRNRPAQGNGARPVPNRSADPRAQMQGQPRPQGNMRPAPGRQVPQNRPNPQNRPAPRNPQGRPAPQNRPVPQQNGGGKKNVGGLARVAVIWVSVLAILLIVIFIIAFAGGDSEENVPAVATTETTAATTTEPTKAVEYAEPSDATVGFAASHDFTNGILIDLETNSVIATRGGDARIFPASMTKIMTMIVAVENAKSLDDKFTMTVEITDPLYLANASVAGFSVGEQVTVRDLIYALILPSGGDGALGLAYHIAGNEEAFAEMMNAKAKELGLKDTHFTNCTGLHGEDHYSTCHEIALMLEYALKDDFMKEVLSTYVYTTEKTPEHPEGIEIYSTLLSRMNGDEAGSMFVQGGKTGYTIEAKNCLASFATDAEPGMSEEQLKAKPAKYILVTAGSGEKFGPVFSAIDIYKSLGKDEAEETTVASKTETEAKPAETKDNSETTKESIKIYTAATPA